MDNNIPWKEKTPWQKTKKVYNYIFNENQLLSWIFSILIAYVVVKFLFYPGLGLVLGTDLPLVAVISPSMEHEGQDFDIWWENNEVWYLERGITKEQFQEFTMPEGFNIGDVIILKGKKEVEMGDIAVYQNQYSSKISQYPIIHRVTFINEDDNSFEVKGDNNGQPDQWPIINEDVQGVALFKIPYIGKLKIWAMQLIGGN